jgi:hypothetical protein
MDDDATSRPPEAIYFLTDDEHQVFYIGRSKEPEKRLREHRAHYKGIEDVGMSVACRGDDKYLMREIEILLIRHYKDHGSPLINSNYAVPKDDKLERARVAALTWRYIGHEENARRAEERLRELEETVDRRSGVASIERCSDCGWWRLR